MADYLPEEKVLLAAGLTPALVQQYSTEIEILNDRQAILRFTGIKLLMDKQLQDVLDEWDAYEEYREAHANDEV